MAVQILAGLARVGATVGRSAATGARAAARASARSAKKLAVRKAKSATKNKIKKKVKEKVKGKLSKESGLISSEGNQQEKKLEYSSMSGGGLGLTPTLTGTTNKIKIKSAPNSKSEVEKLKINVTNIHRFLVKSNKQYDKQQKNTRRNERSQQSEANLQRAEKRLGTKSPEDSKPNFKNIKNPFAGSVFDRIIKFAQTILLGIAVNALPKIIEKVKEVIDSIVNFLTPIQSGFNVIMSFFSDDINQGQLDVDKKRFDDGIQNIQGKGGLLDKIKEKLGPFGGAIDLLKGAIDKFRDILGLKKASTKMKLEKRDGKEGFVNTETGKFTQRQWTSAEREKFESEEISSTSGTDYPDGSVSSAGETTGNKISGYPITSDYGYRTHPVTGQAGKLHGGIDIGTSQGTPVSLTEDGEIVAAGEYGGYGYMIDAWLPNSGVQIRLAHLSEIIKNSGTFKANEMLGKTGGAAGSRGAGTSTGPHLHFEADTRKGSGEYGGSGNPKNYSKLLRLGSFQPNKTSDGQGGVISPIASTPKEKIATINQPMDDEATTTIAFQRVNTIQYVPYMMPIPVSKNQRSFSSTQPQLPEIWRT